MRKIITFCLLMSLIISTHLFPANYKDYTNFYKGITYILVDDKDLAVQHIEAFFKNYPDPALRSVFVKLIQANSWEVTKEFNRYLNINHRSTTALVGIALSTSNMSDTTSIGNLERAIRLQPDFAPAYLCLGVEYMKFQNYPKAKYNLERAIRYSSVPDFKILLAKLHLMMNNPGAALALIKPEADKAPDNFYFHYYTALAYYQLNQPAEMSSYIDTALELNPKDNNAKILMAKYLLNQNELKQAKDILKKCNFKTYNEDYKITFGDVLLRLQDKHAKVYLDEVFANSPWNKDINRLMGIYYQWKKGKNDIQNWINRAVLCGNDPEQLKKVFPDVTFPQYQNIPFFQIKKIQWLNDQLLMAVAIKNSGEKERIYILQKEDLKVVSVINLPGELLEIYTSDNGERMILSTPGLEDGTVNIYAVEARGKSYMLQSIYKKPFNMGHIIVGFNNSGTLAYITHKDITTSAFESPFSTVSELQQKTPVFPDYPFSIFKYNFVTKRISVVKEISQMENVPIEAVKKYFLVYNAMESNAYVRALIEKGQRLDITSSAIVKMFFSSDLSSFLIYLSDLTNAFQAQLVDNINNRTIKIDETMFLGEGQYAELDLLDFNPEKNQLITLTKGTDRTLIRFDYKTRLYTRMADKVLETFYEPKKHTFYVLTERSKKSFYTETNLIVIYSRPYLKQLVDQRRDLSKFLFNEGENIFLTTLDGEMVKMDSNHEFQYVAPSFEGCLHAFSSDRKSIAAFIEGNLYLIERKQIDLLEQWAKNKNSKK